MQRRFWLVSIFTCIEPSFIHYISKGGALHSTHTTSSWSYTSHHTLYSFHSFSSSFWSYQELQGELVSLEERATFVMNTMKSSSKFKFSYHSYSNAYKLEYSCLHVIIVIYELAYSLDVIILTCSTSCLNIHMTSMSRSRVRLRWRFVVPSGLPISFTCQSIGLGTRGGIGSFFVHGRGARVHRNLRI
jgi:hypothetical protein